MRHSVSAKWKSLHNCQGRFGNRYSPSTARYRTCSLKWCAIHCTHNGKAVSALLLRSYSTDFNQIWYSGQDTLCFSEATRLISTKSDIRGKIRFASQKLLDWFQPHLIFGARYALLLRSYSTDFNHIWYSGQDPLCFSEVAWLISTRSDIRGKIRFVSQKELDWFQPNLILGARSAHTTVWIWFWVITSELKSPFHTKLKLKIIIFLINGLSTKTKNLNLTLVQISLGSTVLFVAVIIWVTNYI